MLLRRTSVALLAGLALFVACGDDDGGGPGPGPGVDSGLPPGVDGGPRPDGSTPGVDSGPGDCVPQVEICGDRIDQNCDGRETPCGDSDGDNVDACSPSDTDLTACDCDGLRADVFPGAAEVCDGVDNDCNGRIDEAAECCAGCASVTPHSRADVCLETGECDCSTEAGVGPCGEGMTCCTVGCVDTQTDFENCGYCGTHCSASSDRCVAGECMCGSGPTCDLDYACTGGSCSG